MTKRVILPTVFKLNAIDRFVQEVVGRDGKPIDRDFVFDFQKLDFIDGSGYTVLSNTIEWLLYKKIKPRFINFSEIQREAIMYLDSCGFFDAISKNH